MSWGNNCCLCKIDELEEEAWDKHTNRGQGVSSSHLLSVQTGLGEEGGEDREEGRAAGGQAGGQEAVEGGHPGGRAGGQEEVAVGLPVASCLLQPGQLLLAQGPVQAGLQQGAFTSLHCKTAAELAVGD